MSGEGVPYQLRPNKYIDRQLFLDLLSRVLPMGGVEKYVYISMGAKHLIDHNAVYKRIGIRSLYSFDNHEEVVRRQLKNRPTDSAVCEALDSSLLPGRLNDIIGLFPSAENIVVWLDFAASSGRLRQLQEFVEVLKRLQPNDIARVTLNANAATLGDADSWKKEGDAGPGEFRARRLRDKMGDYVPTDVERVTPDNFSSILTSCLEIAVNGAQRDVKGVRFVPLLITTYQDTHRMLTVTVAACDDKEVSPLPFLKDWEFYAKTWGDIVSISAPDFSAREKVEIDKDISKSPSKILNKLKYMPAMNREESRKAISDYKKFHRYYPSYHHIDI